MQSSFRHFAAKVADAVGKPAAFFIALLVVILWGLTGPIFHFSDTWQLVINTGTTIITFLMVFAIQNTQNRDAKAMHLKLDELIRAVRGARNQLVDLEEMTDAELLSLEKEFREVRTRATTDAATNALGRAAAAKLNKSKTKPPKEEGSD